MADQWKMVKLLTINESTDKNDSTKGWGLWVIQYFMNGESKAVKIVCGSWYTKDGEIRYGAKGMGPKDFDALKPKYAEFLALSKNPPPFPGTPSTPPQEDIEEVPF